MKKDEFRSGFAAIVGRPNVGKSTLMNHLVGQKIAITSAKPQTTRSQIRTVYTCPQGQIIFLDTPGIHKAESRLGEYMDDVALETLSQADVILWLVEPSGFSGAGEQYIASQLKLQKKPVILVMNKIDTVDKKDVPRYMERYRALYPFDEMTVCWRLSSRIFRKAPCIMMRRPSPTRRCVASRRRSSGRRRSAA